MFYTKLLSIFNIFQHDYTILAQWLSPISSVMYVFDLIFSQNSFCGSQNWKGALCQFMWLAGWQRTLQSRRMVFTDTVTSDLFVAIQFPFGPVLLYILPRVGPEQSALSCHFPTSPPSLSFSIFSFFSFLIHASSIFLLFIPSHSTRIVPLRFHVGMS